MEKNTTDCFLESEWHLSSVLLIVVHETNYFYFKKLGAMSAYFALQGHFVLFEQFFFIIVTESCFPK